MIDNSKFNIDGIEYTVLEKVDNYVYLANVKDEEDVCIRKEIDEDGKKYLVGLDDEQEVYKALELFKQKFGE